MSAASADRARNAVSYQFYGWYLSLMGRFDEGLQQAREAQRLDPMSANIADVIVANRLWAHATDEAILEARRLMELRPGYPAVHSMLAQAYAEQGRFLDAVAELEQSADPPVIKNGLLGQLYGLARRQNDARRMLATLERMHPGGNDPVYQMAQVHLGLGDKDRAIALLEKAYSDRSPWLLVEGRAVVRRAAVGSPLRRSPATHRVQVSSSQRTPACEKSAQV
jgi:tetratricopeptide (TPR) repeat protein